MRILTRRKWGKKEKDVSCVFLRRFFDDNDTTKLKWTFFLSFSRAFSSIFDKRQQQGTTRVAWQSLFLSLSHWLPDNPLVTLTLIEEKTESLLWQGNTVSIFFTRHLSHVVFLSLSYFRTISFPLMRAYFPSSSLFLMSLVLSSLSLEERGKELFSTSRLCSPVVHSTHSLAVFNCISCWCCLLRFGVHSVLVHSVRVRSVREIDSTTFSPMTFDLRV